RRQRDGGRHRDLATAMPTEWGWRRRGAAYGARGDEGAGGEVAEQVALEGRGRFGNSSRTYASAQPLHGRGHMSRLPSSRRPGRGRHLNRSRGPNRLEPPGMQRATAYPRNGGPIGGLEADHVNRQERRDAAIPSRPSVAGGRLPRD